LSATNFEAAARLATNAILLDSLRLAVNGAPVEASASADFSGPAWKYRAAIKAHRVPIAPFADSFFPGGRGESRGSIVADARLSSEGASRESLQRNLAGDAFFSVTNAEIRVIGRRLQRILLPVSLLLRIPEIVRSPLQYIGVAVSVQRGALTVKEASVEAEAFAGRTAGVINLSDKLGDSPLPRLPVDFLLARALAKRADLAALSTPTNIAYVKLPSFLKLKGTLGEPGVELSDIAIAGILTRSMTGIVTKPTALLFRDAYLLFRGIARPVLGPGSTNALPAKPSAGPTESK